MLKGAEISSSMHNIELFIELCGKNACFNRFLHTLAPLIQKRSHAKI